ncbi:hypothetical protein H4R27_001117 [Coemansia aciculifera]|nr:hypothetical protein H4R27_001117 [Coemansia aciculifera]
MPATLATTHYVQPATPVLSNGGLHSSYPAVELASTAHRRCLPATETALSGRGLASHLKGLHQKASRALILGQGDGAWSNCNEAIQHCSMEHLASEVGEQQARQLCCRMWILYICVLSSLTELADGDGELRPKRSGSYTLPLLPTSARQVWRSIVTAFGGSDGDVDSEVLVPTVLLCLKLRDARAARDIVEAWLATLADDTLLLLKTTGSGGGSEAQQQRNMARASYMRVCELYTLHILPQLNDFASALDFLHASILISAPARDELIRRLDLLRNPALAQKQARPRTRKKTQAPRLPRLAADPVLPLSAASSTAVTQAGTLLAKNAPVIGATRAVATSKPRALVRRPRSMFDIARRVVRRLVSRWGITLLTMAIAAAVLRLLAQRLRLPPLLNALARKLWSTVKMGTQVTYI